VREIASDSSNSHIAFGDVNLQQAPGTGSSWSPGSGGWPTIRYFNKDTGYDGAPYKKKTSASMCDELGKVETMRAYVTEYSSKPCNIAEPSTCSEAETNFVNAWKNNKSAEKQRDEHERLKRMLESSAKLKGDQLRWIRQRESILSQLLLAHDPPAKTDL